MKIKAAIFDMDGTLVDSLMLWDVLWSEFGRRFDGNADFRPAEQDDKAVRTMLLKDAMELIHQQYGFAASGEELLDIANEIMLDFYENRVELKPGVRAFLEHCRQNGTRMCIASATEKRLVQVAMRHCGLEKYFEKLFSCGDVGKGKDEPDVFLMAQQFMGAEVEETWVFEDSLVAIETAADAGLHTVAIYDRYNFGQEQMQKRADFYIAKGENLTKLMDF